MNKTLLTALCALGACLSQAQIVLTTGSAVEVLPPLTIEANQNESDTDSIVFYEGTTTLASNLAVDGSGPGTYTSPSGTNILSGTDITTYYLHSDKVGSTGTPVTYIGSITFAQKILGVISSGARLTNSDYLGNPATTYSTSGLRDFELSAQEFFTISADEKTISFQNSVTDNSDQLRIVTEAVPEPASMTILGAAVLGFVARKRKRA